MITVTQLIEELLRIEIRNPEETEICVGTFGDAASLKLYHSDQFPEGHELGEVTEWVE